MIQGSNPTKRNASSSSITMSEQQRSQVSQDGVLMSKIVDKVWGSDLHCEEQRSKKQWHLKDARNADPDREFENPAMYFYLRRGPKSTTRVGLVVGVALMQIPSKKDSPPALNFCLITEKTFFSVIVSFETFDVEETKALADDMLAQELLAAHTEGYLTVEYLLKILADSESDLLPFVKEHYKLVTGVEYRPLKVTLKRKTKEAGADDDNAGGSAENSRSSVQRKKRSNITKEVTDDPSKRASPGPQATRDPLGQASRGEVAHEGTDNGSQGNTQAPPLVQNPTQGQPQPTSSGGMYPPGMFQGPYPMYPGYPQPMGYPHPFGQHQQPGAPEIQFPPYMRPPYLQGPGGFYPDPAFQQPFPPNPNFSSGQQGASSAGAGNIGTAARGPAQSVPPVLSKVNDDAQTPLANFEAEQNQSELNRLMRTHRVQDTMVALEVTNLILDDDSTLVRNLNPAHIANIKGLLRANPQSFSAPFVLLVDEKDCPTAKDWDVSKSKNWKYRVIGGNHGARAKYELFQAYGTPVHKDIEAWVYAGLSKQEFCQLGWKHNIDQEYRMGMTNIDKVRACHNVFLEFGMERSQELKRACCEECFLDFTPGQKDSFSKHDPLFQLAWRDGEVWDLQDQIFTMWQNFEVLGQVKPKSPKKTAPKPLAKTKAKSKVAAAPLRPKLQKLSGDINFHPFRALQGINNVDQILYLLRRVISRTITLDQMSKEGDIVKKVKKVKNLFMQVSQQPDWKVCREKFPEETHVKVLSTWAEKLGDKLKSYSKKKRKGVTGGGTDDGVEEEMPASDIPFSFRNFVLDAIAKYNRRANVNSSNNAPSVAVWKNESGEEFSYSLHVQDARCSDSYLEKKNYTLAIADIPYGYNVPGADFDDKFSKEDVLDMVKSFKLSTTAKLWRFVVFHSLQQVCAVMDALEECCTFIEAGIWRKTNILERPPGPRLAWGFENFTIGYYNEDGIRDKESYNFDSDESRLNIVSLPCVTKKATTQLGAIVNPYQKPIALSAWFVEHFSHPGDWVVDFCCGTGPTLMAALVNGRHGVAVDKCAGQIEFVKSRVMTLETNMSSIDEARELGVGAEAVEMQPPIGDKLETIAVHALDPITDNEEEEQADEEAEKPKTPTEDDLQDILDL